MKATEFKKLCVGLFGDRKVRVIRWAVTKQTVMTVKVDEHEIVASVGKGGGIKWAGIYTSPACCEGEGTANGVLARFAKRRSYRRGAAGMKNRGTVGITLWEYKGRVVVMMGGLVAEGPKREMALAAIDRDEAAVASLKDWVMEEGEGVTPC